MSGKDSRKAPLAPLARHTAHALDDLYRRYAGWLGKALAARLRSTPLDIDDLVQETYMRASRYSEEQRRHPKALLMTIAVNLARDQMRHNVVRGGLAEPLPSEEDARIVALAPEQHDEAVLRDAILALPPLYRDVFVLSRFTGLTYEEIASQVGVSVKTVEWRMSKALAMCAARLRD